MDTAMIPIGTEAITGGAKSAAVVPVNCDEDDRLPDDPIRYSRDCCTLKIDPPVEVPRRSASGPPRYR